VCGDSGHIFGDARYGDCLRSLHFHSGIAATDFNKTAPLVLQIHHMFWSLPLLAVVPFVWRKARLSGAILGINLGLVLSDLLHHFVVLPVTVGNTGWHWP
jgi:hypothetical protein